MKKEVGTVELEKIEKEVVELPVLKALTPKGNLKKVVREKLKEQVINAKLSDFVPQDDGSFTIDLAQDTDGTTIRAMVKLTISIKDNFDKKERSTPEKDENDEVVVPTLIL